MTELMEISWEVWDGKYRYKKPTGEPIDQTPEDTHLRTVNGVVPAKDKSLRKRTLDFLNSYLFVPAGRIFAGSGTKRNVTLINCYVCPTIQDSMKTVEKTDSELYNHLFNCGVGKGIMEALSVSAYTLQMGGGIGMGFSRLRPQGALVKRVDSESSGPLTYMDMWHSMCKTIMSAGTRRGAMMATLADWHGDLLKFIEAKHEAGRLTMFNVSILVTDEFMTAVEEDEDWDLGHWEPPANGEYVEFYDRYLSILGKTVPFYVYIRMPAREIWDLIMRSTYDTAEPGVIFIDRINATNNLWYCETIDATNPCGEQPLPPNAPCNLCHVNLAPLVIDPFGKNPSYDQETLKDVVDVAVRFNDYVCEVSLYPTEIMKQEAQGKRRIGLGITGLANFLQQMKINYSTLSARQLTEEVMAIIRDQAYRTSIELAKEKGPFSMFDAERYLEGEFIKTLPQDIQADIAKYGIRNSHLLTIAPTGTTSLKSNNVSSGLEPSFSWTYERKVLQPDGTYKTYGNVDDYGYMMYCEKMGERVPVEDLPPYFISALEMDVESHILMQACIQKYIDSSISKTINIPEDYDFESFKAVYRMAYNEGLKGCTTYRPTPVRGSVLSLSSDIETPEEMDPFLSGKILERPEDVEGKTRKVKWPDEPAALYVTINHVRIGEKNYPVEIFFNTKNPEHYDYLVALSRMISGIFRKGGDVTFVPRELKQVSSMKGGAIVKKKYHPSMLALIGQVIEERLVELGIMESYSALPVEGTIEDVDDKLPQGQICPSCQAPTLYHEEGCKSCKSCGFSQCG